MTKVVSWLRSEIHSRKCYLLGFISMLFVFLNAFPPHSFSQKIRIQNTDNKYRAIHWTVQEGLSQGRNMDMIKDANGFLWISSSRGLNRFDGSNFRKYFADKAKKNNTIAGDDIVGLIEDSLHNIWIGTDQGLSRYDIKADTFRNFFTGKSQSFIIPFWSTRDEVYCWDYPDSQLAAYNIHSFTKRSLVKITSSDTVGSGVSDHYPIYDARSNSVWLAKGRGDVAGGGLLQISLTNGKRQEFSWNCFLKIPKHSHAWEGMRYDWKRNSIWIASPDGLVEFTLADNKFHHIEAFNELEKLKDFHQWAGIGIDPRGRIWVGTHPKGIFIYDPGDPSVVAAFPGDSTLQKQTCEANVLIYCDRDGLVWSGSWSVNGIYQITPFLPAVTRYVHDPKLPNSLSDDFAVTCIDAGKNKIWVGTGGGINILDQQTNLFSSVRKAELGIEKGNDDVIFLGGADTTTQKAWAYAGDRIRQVDMVLRVSRPLIFKRTGQVIPPAGGVSTKYGKSIILSADADDQQGVFIVDGDSAIAQQILSFPVGTIDAFKTATDGDHLIFLRRPASAQNLTYSFIDGVWKAETNPMDSIPWLRIIYNNLDKTYWASTEKAIYHYDRNFRQLRIYNQQDGLPDFEIYGMITDNENNLWFNSESSIWRLDLAKGRITTLSEKDGFKKQNFTPLLEISKSGLGELYLAGGVFGQGFNRISPSKYTETPAFVYLQSLTINQKPASLSTGLSNLHELSLSYFENRISIETGIIDYYSAGNSHIRYRMGEENEWQYPVNSARYTIHYEDLPPGKYKLIMQASNASNEFIGPEKILTINISPPWWQTWWARIIFVLLFAFVIWKFIQYRSRNLKKRNADLEEKVTHRTRELKLSLEELRDTQTQLIQREKMASLGELTAGIAHEIQNPLNFVNNFSDLNRELLLEMKDEMDKGNIPTAREIAKDVMNNEDKINHHGKRADAIVKSMLQHSRSSAGQKEPSDINALADEYLRLSYHGLRSRDKMFKADIQTDFDETLEKINVIPQDIGRVLLNLFNNAFYSINEKRKLSGEGFDPVILVSTKKIANKVEIKVRDNGLGIPQKVLDKVYQPFFTTKAPGEGTGLGLSLSYDIITKIHGGELKVETKEGEFAEFTVILPI